jgi:hypothetical protein
MKGVDWDFFLPLNVVNSDREHIKMMPPLKKSSNFIDIRNFAEL